MELNILASKSPRRAYLLNQIGFKFSVIQSDFAECLNTNLPPNALAETLALGKALKIAKNHRNNIIIGADTIVCQSDNAFGKPRNEQERIDMLKYLSGKSHEVITGVALIALNKGIEHTFNHRTIVKVKNITDEELKNLDMNFYLNFFMVSVASMGFGTTVYIFATKILGPVKSSAYIFSVPFVALISANLMLGEVIQLSTILGGLICLLSVYIINIYKKDIK